MQKKSGIILILVALIVGLGVGYAAPRAGAPIVQNSSTAGMHQMPDGSMMGGGSTTSMADMMTSMNAELQGKTGDDFDKAFLSEMIIHHQKAVQMAQSALMSAKHQEIKDLATGIISAQNKEIAEMQAWQTSWYGSTTAQ